MRNFWRQFRNSAETWPHLDVTFPLLPWHWKFGFYWDHSPRLTDPDGNVAGFVVVYVRLGPVRVKFDTNLPVFIWEGGQWEL